MGEEKICMSIGSREFMLDDQYEFYLFSDNDKNFIIYENEKFNLDDKYNFPEIKDGTYPIRVYCKFFDRLHFKISDYTNHQVRFLNKNIVIKNGEADISISDGSKLVIENPKNQNTQKINFHTKRLSDIKNHTREDIKNTMSGEYNTESDENNVKYNDIELMKDMDKIKGIKNINSGSYRKVFKIIDGSEIGFGNSYNNKIIKVAKSQKGIESNRKESNAWETVKSHNILRQYFAPILHTSPENKYLIIENCDNIKSLDSQESETVVRNIEDVFSIYIDENLVNTPDNHGLDIKIENIGKFEDRYVLFDYPYGDDFLG